MTPGAGVLLLGFGQRSHYSDYALSSTLSIYSTLIAIVLRDYNAAFLCNCLFSFILWWDVDMHIPVWAHTTKSQCRVSDTQVTLKACGPFVSLYMCKISLCNKHHEDLNLWINVNQVTLEHWSLKNNDRFHCKQNTLTI